MEYARIRELSVHELNKPDPSDKSVAAMTHRKVRTTTCKQNSLILLLALMLVQSGCGLFGRDKPKSVADEDYHTAVLKLRLAEDRKPQDWRIKRDLGIAYFKTKQLAKAANKLQHANNLHRKDERTLLYLGLCYERLSAYRRAEEAYRALLLLKPDAALQQELRARIAKNRQAATREELKRHIANLDHAHVTLPRNSVAVLYFRNISNWQELNPIIKGLTHLLVADLENLRSLRVVSRERLQLLLQELQLPPFQFTDHLSVPDAGKFLQASFVVTGGIKRLSETRIAISGGVVETETGKLTGSGFKVRGSISDLIGLEKQILFEIISRLNASSGDKENRMLRQPATSSTLAFIAFAKGLDLEDKGQLTRAREAYMKAVSQDKQFALARLKVQQLAEKRLSDREMETLLASHE